MTTENKHGKAIKVLKEHCATLLDMNNKNAEMFGDMGIMDQIRYESIAEIEKTIRFLESQLRVAKTCEWSQDCDDSELYETECGHTFQFIDGSPDDNDFKSCPFCGGLLSVSKDGTDEH